MIINLELVDDAGQKFGNVIEVTDLDQLSKQLAMACVGIKSMVMQGVATYKRPEPQIVVAHAVPATTIGNSGNGPAG